MNIPIRRQYEIIALVSFFMLIYIPFLWLSAYNVPIGMHEWDWMTDNAGTLPVSWWDKQVFIYENIMGRYTSNAVLSLTSAWCTLKTFPIFFFVWHLAWMVALWGCVRSLFIDFPLRTSLWVTAGIQLLYLTYLHDVYDTMYRYVGLVTYQLGAILCMLAVVFISRWKRNMGNQSLNIAVTLCLLFLGIGTNEVTMLFLITACAVWMLCNGLFKGDHSWIKGMVILVFAIGAAIVILAPGNPARMEGEQGGLGILKLVSLTFGSTAYVWFDWMSNGILILMTLLAIPLVTKGIDDTKVNFFFKDYRPWMWTLLLFVPASMGMLMYAAGGDAFPERVIDHLFIHVLLLWLGLVVSLCIKFKWHEEITSLFQSKLLKAGYLICLCFIAVHTFGRGIDIDRMDKANADRPLTLLKSDSHITNAWLTLIKGDAQKYHRESIQHLGALRRCESDTCYMQRPSVMPVQLYDPLSDRRNRKGDRYMGYYIKQGIKLTKYEVEDSAPKSPEGDFDRPDGR